MLANAAFFAVTTTRICHVSEHVHSQGVVLGDRSVLYKYINPNLMVVTTEGTSDSDKGFINVYLIDAITGHVVFHCTHKKARGPVHVIHSENWIVVGFCSICCLSLHLELRNIFNVLGLGKYGVMLFSNCDCKFLYHTLKIFPIEILQMECHPNSCISEKKYYSKIK